MKKEILVTVEKSEKGEIEAVNASSVAPVQVSEIQAAEDIRISLCFNLMAGNVTPEIPAAIKSRKLSTLLSKMANADRNAVKNLADKKPADIVKAWESHCKSVKRVRGISLQAVSKSYNAMFGEKKETAKPKIEQFLEIWASLPKKTRDMASIRALSDFAIDNGFEG